MQREHGSTSTFMVRIKMIMDLFIKVAMAQENMPIVKRDCNIAVNLLSSPTGKQNVALGISST